MHIFLTGRVQVGKSSLIRRILSAHPEWTVGGFRSVSCLNDIEGALGGVYLLPASGPSPALGPENLIGIRCQGGGAKAFPQVFETTGLDLLSKTGGFHLLMMDELGFMERNAACFSRRVLALLERATPILGVVKPRETPLLDAVRAHPNTEILEVTRENREALFPVVSEKITAAVNARQAFLRAPSCGGAVLRQENGRWETLLIQYWDGHYSFPKGHLEPGESVASCALREIREETGVEVALEPEPLMRIPSALPSDRGDILCFAAHYLSGQPLPQLAEIQSVSWFPLTKAAQAMGFEQDRAFFRKVAERYPDSPTF